MFAASGDWYSTGTQVWGHVRVQGPHIADMADMADMAALYQSSAGLIAH